MTSSEGEVQKERLARRDGSLLADEPDRHVREVIGKVIAFLRRPRGIDRMVVVHQRRVPLAGATAQETVEALDSPTEGPQIVGPSSGLLLERREVPCPYRERVVASIQKDLGQEPIAPRYPARIAGVAVTASGNAPIALE